MEWDLRLKKDVCTAAMMNLSTSRDINVFVVWACVLSLAGLRFQDGIQWHFRWSDQIEDMAQMHLCGPFLKSLKQVAYTERKQIFPANWELRLNIIENKYLKVSPRKHDLQIRRLWYIFFLSWKVIWLIWISSSLISVFNIK